MTSKKTSSKSHSFAPRSKPGSGTAFKKCVESVSHKKGVNDAKAVCASIGRKKYGKYSFVYQF